MAFCYSTLLLLMPACVKIRFFAKTSSSNHNLLRLGATFLVHTNMFAFHLFPSLLFSLPAESTISCTQKMCEGNEAFCGTRRSTNFSNATYFFPAALINKAVASLTCILFGAPLLSIREAVLTVYQVSAQRKV